MMQLIFRAALFAMLCSLAAPSQAAPTQAATRIEWDQSTLRLVQQGATYGRMARLSNGAILCAYESGGRSWTRSSTDEGQSWKEPVLAAVVPNASASNPELLPLQSGRVLLFFNRRPQPGAGRFSIEMRISDDNGTNWRSPLKTLYRAGAEFGNGCWEPSAVQLPSGEIQLFFANEAPFPTNNDQEITLMRSFDDGQTWSVPQTVAYRAGHRDGMPVPLRLQNGDIVLAIEDNGLSGDGQMQPVTVRTSAVENWRGHFVDARSPRRQSALITSWPVPTYAGAPYLRQMLNGVTVLSSQVHAVGAGQWQMKVWIGDQQARNFSAMSQPFTRAGDARGSWNALFVKNPTTITAISETTIDGRNGLWTIDGRLTSDAQPSDNR